MTGHVLVVEDSAVVRVAIRRELTGSGLEVHEAVDGIDAIERLASLEPDVVLCDVEMPRADGYAVLEHLRGHPVLCDVPFLFLTGLDDAEEVAQGLHGGATDYLRKPFAPAELRARVAVALRTKELQDALRDRNDELERLASTDVLTGLFNRRFLTGQAERLLSRHHRHGAGLSCLLFDVDRFKAVNDVHGHAAGDAVLVGVSRRLEEGLRAEDLLGRWGGEELLLLAGDTDLAGALGLAERLRARIAQAPFDAGPSVGVTVSVGVAAAAGGDRFEDVVARADAALYRAKAAGRDRVEAEAPEG